MQRKVLEFPEYRNVDSEISPEPPLYLLGAAEPPGDPRLTSDDPELLHVMLHPTSEFAARFMIIAMMITPLTMRFKGWREPP